VEEDPNGQGGLRHLTGGRGTDGADRSLGELALPGGRNGPQLRDRDHAAQRAVYRASHRMPVVLGPETWPAWLEEEPADACQLKAMLAPYPSTQMTWWPVSSRVGNVKNNDPSLVEPISPR